MTLEMVFERDVHKGNLGFGLQGPDFSLCEKNWKKCTTFCKRMFAESFIHLRTFTVTFWAALY